MTAEQARARRAGRALVDWIQNNRLRSTVAAYSLRGGAAPHVSTPVSWAEVEDALRAGDPAALVLASRAVRDRIARVGDLWRSALELRQRLRA